jgi:AICAR transformylase/IMP cyclohydrolase PurH
VGWIHWDLINEPSYAPPSALWSTRPIRDGHERAAFTAWAKTRHGDDPALIRDLWRDMDDDLFASPRGEEFQATFLREGKRLRKTRDFHEFTHDAIRVWAAKLRDVLRAAGDNPLVTLGQDEGGVGFRPSQQVWAESVDYTAIHTWWNNDDLLWDGVVTKVPEKASLHQETGLMSLEDMDGFPWRTPEMAANLLERKFAYAFQGRGAGVIEWAWNINPYQPIDNEATIGFWRPDGTAKPELRVVPEYAAFFREAAPWLDDFAPDPVVLVIPHVRLFLGRPGGIDAPTRLYFAQKAFRHTARYEAAIAGYFSQVESREGGYAAAETDDVFPYRLALSYEKIQDLRYGENPHQRAAFYSDMGSTLYSVAAARKHQGKELSFNNILDLDAAWRMVTELDDTACVIVKHTNPCGVAVGETSLEAYERAWSCDPTSAFGGILAFNRRVDVATAKKLAGVFVEAVIAPGFDGEAKKALAARPNLRVMDMDTTGIHRVTGFDLKRVMGGILAQQWDQSRLERAKCEVMTKRKPTEDEWKAMILAWTVVKHVKSNAIVFANGQQTVGVGAGQMSRVDAARLAAQKAQLPLAGTAVASDAFFPFRDGLDEVAKAGATAVIQPGGSVKDEEVIAAADEHKLAMVFTGMRHFKH